MTEETYAYTQPIDFYIRVANQPLSEKDRRDVQSISVSEDLSAAGSFSLQLYNWDAKNLKYTWSDDSLFAPGKPGQDNEIEISLGYIDKVEKIFTGYINSLSPSFQAGASSVTVQGYDLRHRLIRGHKTRGFTEASYSDIAQKIAKEAGLTPDITDPEKKITTKISSVAQAKETDLAFLERLAAEVGFETFIQHRTLFFRPKKNDTPATITLTLNRDIISLNPRLKVPRINNVVVSGFDMEKKESFFGSASDPNASSGAANQVFMHSSPVSTKAQADIVAAGQLKVVDIVGSGTCYGRPELKAGTNVSIEGAGERFSGLYKVTSVTHSMSVQGYQTSFSYERDAD